MDLLNFLKNNLFIQNFASSVISNISPYLENTIAKYLAIKKLDLMTNNPKKIKALEDMGIKVNQRIPIFSDTNKYNEKYISTKKSKLGHLI